MEITQVTVGNASVTPLDLECGGSSWFIFSIIMSPLGRAWESSLLALPGIQEKELEGSLSPTPYQEPPSAESLGGSFGSCCQSSSSPWLLVRLDTAPLWLTFEWNFRLRISPPLNLI